MGMRPWVVTFSPLKTKKRRKEQGRVSREKALLVPRPGGGEEVGRSKGEKLPGRG